LSQKISDLKEMKVIRKVGANNQLFGTVAAKQIMDELKIVLPKGTLDAKYVHVVEIADITDIDRKPEILPEVRKAGRFRATVKVHPNIDPARFEFVVSSE
jgi:ribosomal protein L9